jgi:Type IIA topoisomerase (DNA gyrase/topo II, topoisomerase IV), A subunit
MVTDGDENLLIVTKKGLTIHFSEKDLGITKKQSEGVIGIRLEKEDEVIEIIGTKEKIIYLLLLKGDLGKRHLLKILEYRGEEEKE